MNLNKICYRNTFSHIYVEENALNYPAARAILARFPDAVQIPVRHYMEVFSSHRQEFALQKHSQKLILAVKEEPFLYPGAPVCQDFGNQHFYYTSSLMNCLYDCEYCYLQGMYPSANLVLFVNLADIFLSLEKLLIQHPVYLCISYDTDLLALEGLTGYVKKWIAFTRSHPDLTVECRTKSAGFSLIAGEEIPDRFILAWTLSPDTIIQNYEHGTPSLTARLNSICEALAAGCRIRLCFDPVLHVPDWEQLYSELFDTVFRRLSALPVDPVANGQLADISIGTFRISKEYLGQMRKKRPLSAVVQYPFQTEKGVCSYGNDMDRKLMNFIKTELGRYFPESKIFSWGEGEGGTIP